MHSYIQSGRRRGCTVGKSSFTCLFYAWKWKFTRFKVWICSCTGFTAKDLPKQNKTIRLKHEIQKGSQTQRSLRNIFGSQVGLNKVSEHEVRSGLHAAFCSESSVFHIHNNHNTHQIKIQHVWNLVIACGSSLIQPHWHGLATGKVAIKQKTRVKPKRKVKVRTSLTLRRESQRFGFIHLQPQGGAALRFLEQAHTHTHVSRAMSIMFKYLVRLQRVVLCLLWDLLRSHKRSGTDALKPRSRPFKYGPEPNALSQPHSLYCIVLHCIVLYWYLYLYLYCIVCIHIYIYICIIIIYYILSYIIFEWAHSRPLWCAEFQRDQDLWGMPRV